MQNSKKLLNSYDNKGYVLVKSLISKNVCKAIKEKSKKLPAKLTLPFSDQPYGYGDVRNKNPFKMIADNEKILKISKELIGKELNLGHFLLVNKAAWIGPDVEWHQEAFNFDIYASGLNVKKDWRNFIQVFIAIDNHEKDNGCLQVFEGSHKKGILDFEDIVNINGSHKRRVKAKVLEKLIKKHPIRNIEMKSGDVLFFNHLLVHGSPSNISSKSRLSALMQLYSKNLKFNKKPFNDYSNFRAKFVEDYFISSIEKVTDYKKKLADFSKN